MNAADEGLSGMLAAAIVARDFPRVRGLLDPKVDFRAMTPNRIWEAEGPAGVEQVLRSWFEHPDRAVERVEPADPGFVGDTLRVGWRVHGSDSEGPFVYEQQAYVREDRDRVVWMRVMCSGPRPAGTASLG